MQNQELCKLTLDTNCIINIFDSQTTTATSTAALNAIIDLGEQSALDLAVTTTLVRDQYKNQNTERKNHIFDAIEGKSIEIVSAPPLDDSRSKDLFEELRNLLYPEGINSNDKHASNKENDIKQLMTHKFSKRDIFITDDKGILKKKEQLAKAHGITVMCPADFVSFMGSRILTHGDTNYPLFSKENTSELLAGRMEINYSNHNGCCRIGHDIYAFDIKWSACDVDSIYAYDDGYNIEAIAVASGPKDIDDISDIEKFNFSSRCREVKLKDVLILKNRSGFSALVKIISIRNDRDNDNEKWVEFKYKILSQ